MPGRIPRNRILGSRKLVDLPRTIRAVSHDPSGHRRIDIAIILGVLWQHEEFQVDSSFSRADTRERSDNTMSPLVNRWYDPGVGRWPSEDPIGFAGGDANLVRYLGNSITLLADPSGLVPPGRPAGPVPDGFAKWLDGKGPKPPGATPDWCAWYRKVAEEAIEENKRLMQERGPQWTEGPNNIRTHIERIRTIDGGNPRPPSPPTIPPQPGIPWYQRILRIPLIFLTPIQYQDDDGDGTLNSSDGDFTA